jgi:hypothetical protein
MSFALNSTLTAIETAVEFGETAMQIGSKLYMFGSEIFSITAILWVLNFAANMIQKTYNAGYIVGTFYRYHLHATVKEWTLKFIAGVIFVSILFFEGCKVVYNNRHKYLPALNNFRNQIGSHFVYAGV